MDQSTTLLNARVKLQKRHLLEWDKLAINQREVWTLRLEETAQKLSYCVDNKLASSNLVKKLNVGLMRLMGRQRVDRSEMKMCQAHEKALLEQNWKNQN